MHQIAAAKKKRKKWKKFRKIKKMRARNNFVAWACLVPSPCNAEGSITLNPGPRGISPLFAGRYFDVDSKARTRVLPVCPSVLWLIRLCQFGPGLLIAIFFAKKRYYIQRHEVQRKMVLFEEAIRSIHNPSSFWKSNGMYSKVLRDFNQCGSTQ
jgi:hypothetical protein